MGREEDEASKDLLPVGQAKELAAKGIGGWIEGTGDRAIQYIGGAIIGSAAVTALLAILKAHWPIVLSGGIAAMVLFGFLAQLVRGVRDAARTSMEALQATRALLGSSDAAPAAPTIGTSKLATPVGGINIKALGVFRSISIECINDRTNPRQFRCVCEVAFYGPPNTEISPSQLSVRRFNAGPELVRLDASVGGKCPGTVSYTGEGSWSSLMDAVGRTMQGMNSKIPPPWEVFPPKDALSCDIEISVPKGPIGMAHEVSGVKLEFEAENYAAYYRTVGLLPWSNLDQSPRVSITRL